MTSPQMLDENIADIVQSDVQAVLDAASKLVNAKVSAKGVPGTRKYQKWTRAELALYEAINKL